MAITIIKETDTYMPIHSPMMYEVESTNDGETNFKINFQIAIEGGDIRNVKVSPRPGDQHIEFDLSRHLRDYLDYSIFDPTTSGYQTAPHIRYTVTMWEEWIDGSGNFIDYTNGGDLVSATGTKHGSNIVIDRYDWLNFSSLDWRNRDDFLVPNVGNVLLNTEEDSKYYEDDVIFLHIVGTSTNTTIHHVLKGYDEAGNLVTTFPSLATSITPLATRAHFLKIDLETLTIPSNVVKIGITILANLSLVHVTEEKFITLEKNKPCLPYEEHRLIYMDKYGSYNTISLNYKSHHEVQFEKNNFRKRIDPLNDADYKRGLTDYFIKGHDKLTLNTGNLKEADLDKFEDLISSVDVYLEYVEKGAKRYYPIYIHTDSMKRFKSENQEIPQYTIECEYAYTKNLRRRL
jgi:hypothetical protein